MAKWTVEQKLAILREAEETEPIQVIRKYKLSSGTFYSWKKKFEQQGEAGLHIKRDTKDPEWKKVEEENRLLKKLLADKEIQLEVQREMLKKKFGTDDPRKI